MPKQKWFCDVCEKGFSSKEKAVICEDAHIYTKNKTSEESKKTKNVSTHSTKFTSSSRLKSSSNSSGMWRSNFPDAHGWHHSPSPSWD